MSSQRAIRRTLSLVLSLSAALWAENGLALLPVDHQASPCHARMLPAPQVNSMPCCPSPAMSVPSYFFEPPPCCDLKNQPARPLVFVFESGKGYSSPLSASDTASVAFVPPRGSSLLSLIAASPPFVKPVFDRKTDLRI